MRQVRILPKRTLQSLHRDALLRIGEQRSACQWRICRSYCCPSGKLPSDTGHDELGRSGDERAVVGRDPCGVAGASVAGKSVLVTGGGAIGQLIALVARAFGASRVVLSDIAAFPRRLASELGADATLDASASGFHAEAMEFAPEGFEIVFEASGSPQALSSGIELARRGGILVQVGTLPSAVTAPLNAVMARELSIVGSFRFAHVFTNALDLLASRRIDVTPLISAVLPLHMMQAAMDRAVSKDAVIKVQVEACCRTMPCTTSARKHDRWNDMPESAKGWKSGISSSRRCSTRAEVQGCQMALAQPAGCPVGRRCIWCSTTSMSCHKSMN